MISTSLGSRRTGFQDKRQVRLLDFRSRKHTFKMVIQERVVTRVSGSCGRETAHLGLLSVYSGSMLHNLWIFLIRVYSSKSDTVKNIMTLIQDDVLRR